MIDHKKIMKIVKNYLIPILLVPLVLLGIYVSYLRIEYDHDQKIKALMSLLLALLIVFLITFIIIKVFLVIIKRTLIQPLESVLKQIDEINVDVFQDNLIFDFNIPFELHVIKDAINRMLERIRSQYEEIEALYEETTAMNDSLTGLVDEVQDNYRTTIQALSNAIETNDAYTKGHCDRVKEYALKLGKGMGLNKNELKMLEYAAILHDIGKVGIPREILHKSKNLSKAEYELICQHPRMGSEILKDLPYLETIRLIIEQHHERVDGKGYPNGLVETEIHPLAQIICITDSFDAMTTKRPYRLKIMTTDEAIKELTKCAGTQFSIDKVLIFIKILEEEEMKSARKALLVAQ